MPNKARLTVDATGETKIVTAKTFIQAVDNGLSALFRLTCIECGQPVFLNDEAGARAYDTASRQQVFRVACNQATTPQGARFGKKLPSFSHKKGNNGVDCPLYFAADPYLKTVRAHNHFDALEKARNRDALDLSRLPLDVVQNVFMSKITGQTSMAPDERRRLDEIEKKLQSWIGLSENVWVMAYMPLVLMGPRTKAFGRKGVHQVEYRGVGEQRLSVVGLDGRARTLRLPERMQLCFVNRNPHVARSVVRDWDKPVEFPVSRDFVRKMYELALPSARDEATRKRGGIKPVVTAKEYPTPAVLAQTQAPAKPQAPVVLPRGQLTFDFGD